MNLCELAEGINPESKSSEMHLRCVVQIKYEHVYITHSPSLQWRVRRGGLQDPAFRLIAELFNRVSRADAFWNIELKDYARYFNLVYYTKNGSFTLPEFTQLIKEEAVPILLSQELKDSYITFFEEAVDYNSISITETDFFKRRYR